MLFLFLTFPYGNSAFAVMSLFWSCLFYLTVRQGLNRWFASVSCDVEISRWQFFTFIPQKLLAERICLMANPQPFNTPPRTRTPFQNGFLMVIPLGVTVGYPKNLQFPPGRDPLRKLATDRFGEDREDGFTMLMMELIRV